VSSGKLVFCLVLSNNSIDFRIFAENQQGGMCWGWGVFNLHGLKGKVFCEWAIGNREECEAPQTT